MEDSDEDFEFNLLHCIALVVAVVVVLLLLLQQLLIPTSQLKRCLNPNSPSSSNPNFNHNQVIDRFMAHCTESDKLLSPYPGTSWNRCGKNTDWEDGGGTMNFDCSSVHDHKFGKIEVTNCRKASHKVGAVAADQSSWKRKSATDGSTTSSSSTSPAYVEEFAESSHQSSKERPSSLSSSSPTQNDPSLLALKAHAMEALISSMFTSISSLKNAFLQLHSAQAPSQSAKTRLAESSVIAELKKISEIKQIYRSRMAAIPNTAVSEAYQHDGEGRAGKGKEATAYDRIISSFHTEIQNKDGVIRNMREALGYMEMKKEKLEKKVQKLEKKLAKNSSAQTWSCNGDGSVTSEAATMKSAFTSFLSPCPELLEWTVIAASEASKDFAKLLVSLMKSARWDIDAAANAIEPGIVYTRETHKKFAFESYVSRRMLSGFESKDMSVEGGGEVSEAEVYFREFLELRSATEPEQTIIANAQGAFGKYCLRRFLDLIHPKMEESFFGHHEQQLRKQVCSGMHPFHSQFYQSYLRLARKMWMLHRLALSFRPQGARIFEVKKGEDFCGLYMESMVQQQPWMVSMEEAEEGRPKVCFTVMPGFRVHSTIIKCQVYVAATTR